MSLSLPDTLPALTDPEPTADKRVRAAQHARTVTTTEVPALDMAALQRRYRPDTGHAPRQQEGTFCVPLNISVPQYESLRNQAVQRFVDHWQKDGWDLVPEFRIRVYPGIYPSRDLLTGLDLLDRRDMIVRAYFRLLNPQPVRIELPPHLLNPYALAA